MVKPVGAEDLMKIIFEELEKIVSANTILGKPVDIGEKVIVPVAGFGFGFGAGEGRNSEKGGSGTGGGAGAGITPVAVIIAHKDVKGPEGIQVLSLQKHGAMAEVIGTVAESLPTVVEAIKSFTGAPKERKEE